MTSYLDEEFDLNSNELVSIFDELPLWSSYFGTKLLDLIDYKNNLTVLDIGSGAGFPLIELAQRLGSGSKLYGIDPWESAGKRVQDKIKTMNIKNVNFINQTAESLPFSDNKFDLIVSNNGINNVQDPESVLSECCRVMKKGSQFLISVNLPESMIEFYSVFRRVLESKRLIKEIDLMDKHIRAKRKTLEEYLELFKRCNLKVKEIVEDSFYMRYADGTAFLNHYFIKLAFLDSWKNIIEKNMLKPVFDEIEKELNHIAAKEGHLKMTIPFVVINCYK